MIIKQIFTFFITIFIFSQYSVFGAATLAQMPTCSHRFEYLSPEEYRERYSTDTLNSQNPDDIWNLLTAQQKKMFSQNITNQCLKINMEKRKTYFHDLSDKTKTLLEDNTKTEEYLASFILANYCYNQTNSHLGLDFTDFCNQLAIATRITEQRKEGQEKGPLTAKLNNATNIVSNILKADEALGPVFKEKTQKYKRNQWESKEAQDRLEKTLFHRLTRYSYVAKPSLEIGAEIIAEEIGEFLAYEAYYALFGIEELKKKNERMKKILSDAPKKRRSQQEKIILAHLDANQSYFDENEDKPLTKQELLKSTKELSEALFAKEKTHE